MSLTKGGRGGGEKERDKGMKGKERGMQMTNKYFLKHRKIYKLSSLTSCPHL